MNFKIPNLAHPLFLNLLHPIHPQLPDETSPAPSSYTDATPVLSQMTSDQPDPNSPVTEAQENELDIFLSHYSNSFNILIH